MIEGFGIALLIIAIPFIISAICEEFKTRTGLSVKEYIENKRGKK